MKQLRDEVATAGAEGDTVVAAVMERSVVQVPSDLLPAFQVTVQGAYLRSERAVDHRSAAPDAATYYGLLASAWRARPSVPEPTDSPEPVERGDLLTLD